MRDPYGVCIRRSFPKLVHSEDRPIEPPVSLEDHEISCPNVDSPLQCSLPPMNEVYGHWTTTQSNSTEDRLTRGPRDVCKPGPPERSHSCAGRIEGSSTHAKCQVRKQLSFAANCPDLSVPSALPEPRKKSQSAGSLWLKIGETSVQELIKSIVEEVKNEESVCNNSALECGDVNDSKIYDEKLPVQSSDMIETTIDRGTSQVPFSASRRKRSLEDEDADMLCAFIFKKPRYRNKELRELFGFSSTVAVFNSEKPRDNVKETSSQFQPSEWSSIDCGMFNFALVRLTPKGRGASTASSSMPVLEDHISIKVEPPSYDASPAILSINTQEAENPNLEPIGFLSALETFNEVIPQCNARERLVDNPNWCLANKRDGTRCQWRVAQVRTAQLLDELAALNIFIDMQKCLDELIAFTKIAVCHHQQQSVIWKLKSLLREHQSRNSIPARATSSDLQTEGSALTKPQGIPNHSLQKIKDLQNPLTAPFVSITYWLRQTPVRALSYLPEYLPYQSTSIQSKTLIERVLEHTKEPLFNGGRSPTSGYRELDERKDGYIYVYWNRASFGLVKIGCTTRDVDQRLVEWEEKCHHLVEEHYRSPFKIKHVARVEKLLHAEFEDYRVFEPFCHGCGGKHIEWFKGLNLDHVIKRIGAWTEWIMQEPYEENAGSWHLKKGLGNDFLPTDERNDGDKSTKKGKSSASDQSYGYHLRRRRSPRLLQVSLAVQS